MTLKIRVLGCSGAIAKECRTTSFLIDDDLLMDAGTGVGELTLEEMQRIEHVFLTHSHLDHIAALPLMLDAIASYRSTPVKVYALPETIAALMAHIFNNVIWPDFTRIPSTQAPLMQFQAIERGQKIEISDKQVEALPAVHAVPALGYAVSKGVACWAFTGDTERNPAFWQRINQMNVSMLVVETAFSRREKELAVRSLHLSPDVLAEELIGLATDRNIPIYITHTKPAETELIMSEVQQISDPNLSSDVPVRDIRWLFAGQEFVL
jgi:ribonuclease BN (tRNA processing enzyme)